MTRRWAALGAVRRRGEARRSSGRIAAASRGVLAACAAVLLVGCGVPLDSAPRALPTDVAPLLVPPPGMPAAPTGGTPAPTGGTPAPSWPSGPANAPPASAPMQLWFIRDGRLVAVQRTDLAPRTLAQVAQVVATGPTPAQRAVGLTTAVPDGVGVGDVQQQGSTALVTLTRANPAVPGPGGQPSGGQPSGSQPSGGQPSGMPLLGVPLLGVAQLVLTLTAQPGVVAVQFRDATGPLDVPRFDGSLTSAPVGRDAYLPLVPPPPAGSP